MGPWGGALASPCLHESGLVVLPVLVLAHLKLLLDHDVQTQQAQTSDAHQPRQPEANAEEQRRGEHAVRALAPIGEGGDGGLVVRAALTRGGPRWSEVVRGGPRRGGPGSVCSGSCAA